MKHLIAAALYLAVALGASPAVADVAAAEAARDGDMKKLVFHPAPREIGTAEFDLADDAGTATLADWRGKVVLVNFWATWCAPCRKEMPALAELQAELVGEHFEVLTIATGRNSPTGIVKFFEEIGEEAMVPVTVTSFRRLDGANMRVGRARAQCYHLFEDRIP